jgi:OmpA-OmpF porin, OOP family
MTYPTVPMTHADSNPVIPMRVTRLSAAIVVSLALGGCATLDGLSDKASDALHNAWTAPSERDFNSRVYAGAGAGTALLSPDTSDTRYTLTDRQGGSTQLRLGVDINPVLALELDTSILGAATVREVEADVSYTSVSTSALFYGLGKPNNRARRVGWQGYGRLGYSLLQRASVVQPFDGSDTGVSFGLGAEYGFQNGLALRGEVSRYASDATLIGLGVVYRMGLSASEFGSVVAHVAKDSVAGRAANGAEPSLGAALPDTAKLPGHVSLVHEGPHAALWSQPKAKNDQDGDGVFDRSDLCPDTARNTAVSQGGCGLFDQVLTDVSFKSGTHWLSPKSKRAIDEVVDVILAFPEARIEVQAHADNRGSEEINQIVSDARAKAVMAYMVEKGVGEKQLIAKGYGESSPLVSNDSDESRRTNRRIQLVTLPSLTPDEIASQRAAKQLAAEAKVKQEKLDAEKRAANITLKPEEIQALAKAAGAPPAKTSAEEPALGAALPASNAVNTALQPAVYVRSLGLGGIVKGLDFVPGTNEFTASSFDELDRIRQKLQEQTALRVAFLVHVNELGDTVSNLALSREQANALVSHFVNQGIDRERLIAEPYGDTLPVAQAVTEADRNRNRRVELRVINPAGR